MKKILTAVLMLALILMMASCGGAGTKMTMGTGGTSGTYYGYGGVLGQYITNNAGVNVTVVSTDGSKMRETISWEQFSQTLCLMRGKEPVPLRRKEKFHPSVPLQVFMLKLFSL